MIPACANVKSTLLRALAVAIKGVTASSAVARKRECPGPIFLPRRPIDTAQGDAGGEVLGNFRELRGVVD